MRCPVCRADNAAGPTCRRCRADLALLFTLEEQRAAAVAMAQAAAARGRWDEARAAAARGHELRRGEDTRRLLAACQLLCRDFPAAWASYRTPPGDPS